MLKCLDLMASTQPSTQIPNFDAFRLKVAKNHLRSATLLKKRLRHFAKLLRTPFLQNSSGRPLLMRSEILSLFLLLVESRLTHQLSYLSNAVLYFVIIKKLAKHAFINYLLAAPKLFQRVKKVIMCLFKSIFQE